MTRKEGDYISLQIPARDVKKIPQELKGGKTPADGVTTRRKAVFLPPAFLFPFSPLPGELARNPLLPPSKSLSRSETDVQGATGDESNWYWWAGFGTADKLVTGFYPLHFSLLLSFVHDWRLNDLERVEGENGNRP